MNIEGRDMNCQEAQTRIDDYLDGQLSSTQAKSLLSHCDHCDDCANSLKQARRFRQILENVPFPPPSAGFVDRALRHAVQQAGPTHRDSHRKGFITGFGSAIAAGLALWTVVTVFPLQHDTETQTPAAGYARNQQNDTQQNESAISISLLESTKIKLAFHAAQAVQGATITISLSDNLELEGYQNRQTLEWKTDLLAGDNVLTLPIKALQARQGKIIAQISHSNLMKSIELKLDVKNNSDVRKPVSKNLITTTPVA